MPPAPARDFSAMALKSLQVRRRARLEREIQAFLAADPPPELEQRRRLAELLLAPVGGE